jgi:ribosomal protein S18 acetylase RimI-like enzyme
MQIVIVDKLSPWLLEGLNTLLPQLSGRAQPLSAPDLEQILACECTTLVAAVENQRLMGCLTLVLFQIPTGKRARIEDVVVDAAARGRGIGGKILRHAIALAREKGAAGVDLTANPKRSAANRLYQALGFVRRETNTYRLIIT